MPNIRQGLEAGNAETCDARIGRPAGSNERLDTTHTDMTGTSRSPPEPRRWVPQRKAEIVAAVRGGYLSLDEARKRYALSIEEYLTWQREIDRFGLAGLRVYRPQPLQRAEPRFKDQ
jgi:hypothetical protein